ncbi:MAG: hypothetical protein PHX62_09520 [Bacilli bacterium]|nr:hypothetical protein [Bacilli bacterium]
MTNNIKAIVILDDEKNPIDLLVVKEFASSQDYDSFLALCKKNYEKVIAKRKAENEKHKAEKEELLKRVKSLETECALLKLENEYTIGDISSEEYLKQKAELTKGE